MPKIEFDTEEHLRVEKYGKVLPHQVWLFNLHLQANLKAFDKDYKRLNGRIGSPHHQFHRGEFAKLVAETLIRDINDDEPLGELTTQTEYHCPGFAQFKITQKTSAARDFHPIPDIPFPSYNSDKEAMVVELFGHVRPHQSAALNYQLQECLKLFDKEYQKTGGQIGSLAHRFERMEFAKATSQTFFDEYQDNDGDIPGLITWMEHPCRTIGCTIKIEVDSTIGNENKLLTELPFYTPD